VTIKTVFLDRDGIIVDTVMRGTTIGSARTVEELRVTDDFPKLYDAIKNLNLFVVSNQPDVTRGLLAPQMLDEFNNQLRKRFNFREIIYCTHDDSSNCDCRKPKPGMLVSVMEKHGLNANEAVIIGDSYKDILAGQAAGVRTIYCVRSYNSTIPCKPDFVVHGLEEVPNLPLFAQLS
jgi:D-glycero-D-manno-heptose 1,7-bisphosphate phosphatase